VATAYLEFTLPVNADVAWTKISDFGGAHRLAPGFIADCSLDESGARLVRFANGMEARERLVSSDPARRRIVYTAIGGPAEHHNAAMHVISEGDGARVLWTTDILPGTFGPIIQKLMEEAATAIKAAIG
jgi:Polyketide cyclase / dehydrase and lipid transport